MASITINGENIKFTKRVVQDDVTRYYFVDKEVYVETNSAATEVPTRDPVEPTVPAPKSKAQRKRDAVAKAQNLA